MLELGRRQNMTGMKTERATGKCIANALICQLCWTFLFTRATLCIARSLREQRVRLSVTSGIVSNRKEL